MKMIKVEKKEAAKEIISQFQFISPEKCKRELTTLAQDISVDQLEDGKDYYILDFGKIRSDKPEAYYFTSGKFNKEISNSKKLIFTISTAWGYKDMKYAEDALLMIA